MTNANSSNPPQPLPVAIPPDLFNWIAAEAQKGTPPPSMVALMCERGWAEPVAIAAVEAVLQEIIRQRRAVNMPEPNLNNSPSWIDVDGRRVNVVLSLREPRIVVFTNLLSDDECDYLIEGTKNRMTRSLTVSRIDGSDQVDDVRTSNGMFYARGESELIDRIERRIAQLVNYPVENGEGIQMLNYKPGAEYKPHQDYFDPVLPGSEAILARGGQRVGTVVMYLNTPENGGGTTFPEIGLEVAAQKGTAVFFSYDRPHPSTKTLHGGAPVIAGEKWIAVKWMREREFI